jgi:hypothetical protein
MNKKKEPALPSVNEEQLAILKTIQIQVEVCRADKPEARRGLKGGL